MFGCGALGCVHVQKYGQDKREILWFITFCMVIKGIYSR